MKHPGNEGKQEETTRKRPGNGEKRVGNEEKRVKRGKTGEKVKKILNNETFAF